MGPPFLNGGNVIGSTSIAEHRHAFNGAAVSQRRKHLRSRPRPCPTTCLQWGRRFSTAETGTPPTQAADEDPFNGAAVSQRRKPWDADAAIGRVRPSMGPPFLNGGNLGSRHTAGFVA